MSQPMPKVLYPLFDPWWDTVREDVPLDPVEAMTRGWEEAHLDVETGAVYSTGMALADWRRLHPIAQPLTVTR